MPSLRTFKPEAKFGVELEFSSSQTRWETLTSALDVAGVEWIEGETPERWSMKTDPSCGYEITSPAFEPTCASLNELYKVVATIRRATYGNGIARRSCGLHIHIETRGWNINIRQKFVDVAFYFEPVIFRLIPPSRRNCHFCNPLRSLSQGDQPPSVDRVMDRGKYSAINMSGLYSSNRRSTVEIRYGAGTSSPTKVVNWARMWLRIHEMVSNGKGIPNCWWPSDPNVDKLLCFMNWQRTPRETARFGDLQLSPMVQNTVSWIKNRAEEFNTNEQENNSN